MPVPLPKFVLPPLLKFVPVPLPPPRLGFVGLGLLAFGIDELGYGALGMIGLGEFAWPGCPELIERGSVMLPGVDGPLWAFDGKVAALLV